MTDFRFVDDLARRISEAIPPGVNEAREDIEANVQAILNKAFERMELVTRDQFEAQTAVLQRLDAKLTELEQQLSDLQSARRADE